jgi:hypothetical protein
MLAIGERIKPACPNYKKSSLKIITFGRLLIERILWVVRYLIAEPDPNILN